MEKRRLFPVLAHFSIPNVTTTVGAALGVGALMAAASGRARAALTCLCGAILADRLDGMLARRLGSASDFGRELDSLADGLSFCVVPALLAYLGGMRAPLEVLAEAAFVLCGLWRLAHFNITGMAEGERFTGVPTTVAASWFLIVAVAARHLPTGPLLVGGYLALGALLMISAFPYRKNGLATRGLYLLLPASLAVLWLF